MTLEKKLDQVFNLYLDHGNEQYIGENISQTSHMIQAAMLAEKDREGPAIILSALFHDIGQLVKKTDQIGIYGNVNHERIGYDYLSEIGFQYPIPDLVLNHVRAKRYLTFKYPEYFDSLTTASKETLKNQGGPMLVNEAVNFEQDPLFEASIKIRNFDDNAKDPNIILKDISYYKELCYKYLIQTESNL